MPASNITLQKNVLDELAFDPSIDARNIVVGAEDGVVTLTGTVANYAQKLAAEKAVKRVRGAQGIADELTIALSAANVRSDVELTSSALQALRWNAEVPVDSVFVTVTKARLRLTGTVDWQYQRDAARLTAASVPGIRGVTSEIVLNKQFAGNDIKARISESFRRSSEIDSRRILVEAIAGVVTLRGAVHSWTEREDASSVAYSIAGVSDVRNLTTVS